ncbi:MULTISPECIES: multidrug efflux SMR transporter [Microbacterium]|uniref:DMT family transporter n=1 Tax=Microbacterium TaxID=33882 RepID=UPI0027802AD1|nr:MULTISPECIES: SMR family transporter [Microbacterium]MDQ1075180.1 small multidrug resistance pump [Microbacterium sp. SORGH_AS_0969]MDQ1115410.1 small multidrug resistance pump [Microbacterium testaceum]
MSIVLLSLAIAAEVTATLSLRASEGGRRRRWIPSIVLGYITAFTLLGAVLALGMPVAVAYATWASIGVAATAVLGRVLFGDHLSVMSAVGIVVIIGGVLLVETGSAHP